MLVALEVSRPIQWRPFAETTYDGLYAGWLYFAFWIAPGTLTMRMCRFHTRQIRADFIDGNVTYYDTHTALPRSPNK